MSNIKRKELSCDDCPIQEGGIFKGLSKELLLKICKHKITRFFKKGETLFTQDSVPLGFFCINRGSVKLSKVDNVGQEVIVRLAIAGDIVGYRSIIVNGTYCTTATALGDVVACFIDTTYFKDTVSSNSTVVYSFLRKIAKDLGESEQKLANFSHKSVREKLAVFLLMLIDSHGEILENGKIKLNICLSREDMAIFIGVATETLIRFMSELKSNGIIEQNGKTIIIANKKQLQDTVNL